MEKCKNCGSENVVFKGDGNHTRIYECADCEFEVDHMHQNTRSDVWEDYWYPDSEL